MSASTVRTVKIITGGAGDMPLSGVGPTKTTITVHGSVVGNVTVTAKVAGGTLFNAVTDGTIDLSERDYIHIPDIPLEALHIAYDGAGDISVVALQFPTA